MPGEFGEEALSWSTRPIPPLMLFSARVPVQGGQGRPARAALNEGLGAQVPAASLGHSDALLQVPGSSLSATLSRVGDCKLWRH